MKLEYRSHYFDDSRAKVAFEKYAQRVFGLDFGLWKARGLWDEQYVPFSAFAGGECVASICVYPSEITINGRQERWGQLLTVGTLPEYRKRGIQKEIWREAESWISENCELAFLFTDDSAAGFYEKLRFIRQPEYYGAINYSMSSPAGGCRFRKLDLKRDADFAIIKRLAFFREPVSDRLGFRNPRLLLFMFLYVFRDWSYYLEDLDAAIVVEEADDKIRVHDIIARKMPRFAEIERFLGHFQKGEMEFLFCTTTVPTFSLIKTID